METILFDDSELTAPADASASVIPGKLFEAGDYPDKGVTITEDDLDAAVQAFTSAPMNYEHKAGVLDGALGKISRVWRQGASLMADFEVPHFLRDFAKAKNIPLKVSAEWDRATKSLTGGAWTLNPRIKDAELVAAFSTAQESETKVDPPAVVPQTAEHHHSPPLIKIRPGDNTMTAAEKNLRALVSEGKATFSEDQITAMFAEDNKSLAARREADIAAAADKIADGLIASKKAMPFEKPSIIAAFTQAGRDDAAQSETITFSVDGKDTTGTRVDLLKVAFDARIPHQLTDELLDPTLKAADLAEKLKDAQVVFSKETTPQTGEAPKPSAERTAALLKMTPEGRAALAAAKGN